MGLLSVCHDVTDGKHVARWRISLLGKQCSGGESEPLNAVAGTHRLGSCVASNCVAVNCVVVTCVVASCV